jgi:NADPH2:quinone reductase
MKAVVLEKFCSLEVLKVTEVPEPTVGSKDVLVRIKYAGVNYADILSRQALL